MPVILRWFLRLGPTNPIAVRLVQNGSRRLKHLYIRGAYLAALVLVLLWTLLIRTANSSGSGLSYRELAAAGSSSFTLIAYLQIGLICILAPVFMAGAIAQEANPRTWEVLLTTPLTRMEIVLGNLLGRLFFILALLFASLPLFAITQYFGGVPGRSIFTSYLIAACAAVLVGTIAIALSVSRMVGRRAVFAFYVAVVSYLAVTLAIDLWLRRAGAGVAGGSGVTWMTAINPFLALFALLNPSNYPSAPPLSQTGLARWFLERPVATWCWGSSILSLLLMAVSTITVRSGGIQSLTGDSPGIPWYRKVLGLGAKGALHRPPRTVWHNPIAWREAAARNATLGRIIARWMFVAVGGLFGLALIAFYHGGRMDHTGFRFAITATVFGEMAVIALVAVNMAGSSICREREDGTLDLLTTTPITSSQYLSGKLRGLIAYLLPMLAVPIGTLAVAGLYVLAGGLGRAGGVSLPERTISVTVQAPVILPEAGILAALVFVPFIAAIVMLGMMRSLDSKGSIGAVVSSVALVGVLSGIVGMCGYNAGSGVQLLGPFLAALSPASLVLAITEPVRSLRATIEGNDLAMARVVLFMGACAAAGIHAALIYGLQANMVRNFDMKVRKLAGAK
jgi:ABC-type transport system involved in multi-copper enzyme maturation permease subunit